VSATAAARNDDVVRVASTSYPDQLVSCQLTDIAPRAIPTWSAYVFGVIAAFAARGLPTIGVDVLVHGNLPHGAGLSSSAALECAVAAALNDMQDYGLDRVELAAVAQSAENDFVGVPCGSLDQSASLMCEAGRALLLDTRSGERRQLPLDLESAELVLLVINTRATHELVDGEYAARRHDCETACAQLGVAALRDIATADFAPTLARLGDERLRRRVRHVVTENQRVLDVVEILDSTRDPSAIGLLLTASHLSLRDDYEVSCRELDAAVDAALQAGAWGARMTGGGFGGSAIVLADTESASRIRHRVHLKFAELGFTEPETFQVTPAAGARRLSDTQAGHRPGCCENWTSRPGRGRCAATRSGGDLLPASAGAASAGGQDGSDARWVQGRPHAGRGRDGTGKREARPTALGAVVGDRCLGRPEPTRGHTGPAPARRGGCRLVLRARCLAAAPALAVASAAPSRVDDRRGDALPRT
jgi:galactokinase